MEVDDDCLIVSEDIKPAAKKKLKVPFPMKTKQALLPFGPISSKQKKETEQKRAGNGSAVSSLPSESRKEKKRKLSGPTEDQLPSAKKPASAKQTRYCPDAEVSSSCDEVSIASPPASNGPAAQDKPRSGGLLKNFVRREPTQQAEVSTSVLDDKDNTADKTPKDDPPNEEDCSGKKNETNCSSAKSKLKNKKKGGKGRGKANSSSDSSAEIKGINDDSMSASNDCSVSLERLSPDLCGSVEELDSELPRKKIKLDTTKSDEPAKTTPKGRSSLANKSVKTNDKGNLLTAFLKRGSPRIKEAETKALSPASKTKSGAKTKSADKLNESADLSTSNDDTSNNAANNSASVDDTDCDGSGNGSKHDESCEEGDSSASGTPSSKAADDSCKEGDSSSSGTPSSKTGVKAAGDSCKKGDSNSSGTPSAKSGVKAAQKITPKTLAKQREKKRREEERVKKQQEILDLKRQKEEEKAKKEEERLRLKKEKEDELKRQREEKEQLKEERNKKKQEEIEAKNKEREEKRLKLEEEKRAKEEERLKKEEEKKAKEEEKKAKEEEKKAKEEEKKRLLQEEEERKKKVAKKFANFFMPNKAEPAPVAVPATEDNSGPFMQMQVSRNTALAPVQRCLLTDSARAALDASLTKSPDTSSTYLVLLRAGSYTPQTASATPRPVLNTPDDKDDCLIIEEKEDDDDDDSFAMGESVVFSESRQNPKKYRGKLLKFCENRRPPYWGTWTKKAAAVGPRKPFAKEQIFDYEYDSDDDWEEEEENGESLSDSEGEKDEEEDEQYEVDNDFFVPHGYLSDDEGQEKEDEDEEENKEGKDEDSDKEKASATKSHNNQEKLKAKQAEFEKELKKQTKQLKPRVLGCLWLHQPGDQSGAAYEHLLRVLSGHGGVVCPVVDADAPASESIADDTAMGGMIPCLPPTPPASPDRPSPPDMCQTPMSVDSAAATPGSVGGKITYYKTFPEEAIPSLVRLVHGNKHGKAMLVKEFEYFWRMRHQRKEAPVKTEDEVVAEDTEPSTAVPQAPFIALSKNIIRLKLSEIGEYMRCPDKGPSFKQVMWYVSSAIREQHGVTDATIPNQWSYCLEPKQTKATNDTSSSDAKTPSASGAKIPGGTDGVKTPSSTPSRTPATNLITKFTKVLTEEEKAAMNMKKKTPPPKPSTPSRASSSAVSGDDDIIVLDDDDDQSTASESKVSSGSPNVVKVEQQTPKTKAATVAACTPARDSSSENSTETGEDTDAGSAKKGVTPSNKRGRSAKGDGSAKKTPTTSGAKKRRLAKSDESAKKTPTTSGAKKGRSAKSDASAKKMPTTSGAMKGQSAKSDESAKKTPTSEAKKGRSAKKTPTTSGVKKGQPAKSDETAKKALTTSGKKTVAPVPSTPTRAASMKKTTPKSSTRSIMSFLKKTTPGKSPSRLSPAKGTTSSPKTSSSQSEGSGLDKCDSDCIVID